MGSLLISLCGVQMARQIQASKMGKRKRGSKWGTRVSKRQKKSYAGRYRPAGTLTPRLSLFDYGFPDKVITKMKYGDKIDLSGVQQTEVFRANSMFDPDLTIVGHQPMYFDQFALIYAKYRVRGAKITATFSYLSGPSTIVTNFAPALCYVIPQNSSTLLANSLSYLLEDNNAVTGLLQDKSGGNNVVKLSGTYSPSRDLGLDPQDDTLAASTGSNPTQTYNFHVGKFDASGNAATVQAFVEIEYLVEFFQRNEATQS